MGLKAVGMMNGIGGLSKMFGVPYPSSGITGLLEKAGGMVDTLEKESSVTDFDVLQGLIDDRNGDKQTKRGAELRKVTDFFDRHDPDREYGVMQRVCGEDGNAVWTTPEGAKAMQSESESTQAQIQEKPQPPPPQPGLQAEVDELKMKLQSMKTQDEPRLRTEVDELKIQLAMA